MGKRSEKKSAKVRHHDFKVSIFFSLAVAGVSSCFIFVFALKLSQISRTQLSRSLEQAKPLEILWRVGSKFNHNYTSYGGLYQETCLIRGNSTPGVGTTLSIWHDSVYLNVPNLANC